jgi:hypothetical protein
MKSNQSKLFSLFLFLTLFSVSLMAQSNFSGTWKLDREKSTLNEQFSMAPNQMILSQTDNELSSQRKSSFQGQDFDMSEKYTLDGKECINSGFMDTKKKSVATWNEDKSILKIISKIPMQDGNEMTLTETYQLENSMLKVIAQVSSSFGDGSETFVFDKQ